MTTPKLIYLEHAAELLPYASVSPSVVIANAARVSRLGRGLADPEECREQVLRLMAWEHWSPFEFWSALFAVTTTRAVSHELVRHRMASYLQESQRYCRYEDGLSVIMPGTIRRAEESVRTAWRVGVENSFQTYLGLLETGKPEDARTVLPSCVATRLWVKMNLRSFRNFLNQRIHRAAWSEMRALARVMARAFREQYPEDWFLIQDVVHEEVV